MKIVNNDGENLHIFWATRETSRKKELFKKDVTYDNIKSHKNAGVLEKPQGWGTNWPSAPLLVKS